MRKLLGLIGLGAALKYLFDPQRGRSRRAMVQSRLGELFSQGAQRGEQLGQTASSKAQSVVGKAKQIEGEGKEPTDDVTLARKVESEIFSDEDVPKGQINVNAENGKIVLRGEVGQQEMISDLEKRARSVQGVSDVENLLHLPGAEAPMHGANS
ncbi:MAG: BON domain-containing protein [Gaiellaceae bacterium]